MLTSRDPATRKIAPDATPHALGIELRYLLVAVPGDFEAAAAALAQDPPDGLAVPGTPGTIPHRRRIIELAAERRLPAIYGMREFATEGGLMVYAPNQSGNFHRAATFVDKVLTGANPAELPVECPTKFGFIINLQTARTLGLTIPPHVLAQATVVSHPVGVRSARAFCN
jgi:putative ABC transport system substrate-binding protein